MLKSWWKSKPINRGSLRIILGKYCLIYLSILGVFLTILWDKGNTNLNVLELILGILPWGLITAFYFLMSQAHNYLRNKGVFIRNYRTLLKLSEVKRIVFTKTTITKEPINIRYIYLEDKYIQVTGEGYNPRGTFVTTEGQQYLTPGLSHLLKGLVLCTDTWLVKGNVKIAFSGSPLEDSFVVAGAKGGIWREDLDWLGLRERYLPFNPQFRWSGAIYTEGDNESTYLVGDPDTLFSYCQYWIKDNQEFSLTTLSKKNITQALERMRRQGLKTICVTYRPQSLSIEGYELPTDLTFLGLVGIEEWPNSQVNSILKSFRKKGLEVNLLSGDNHLTVESFAQTMPINYHIDWSSLKPGEKAELIKKWSTSEVVLFFGTKESDLTAMESADLAFCSEECIDLVKAKSHGIILRGQLEELLSGIEVARWIKSQIDMVLNLSLATTAFIGSLMAIQTFIGNGLLPWWFWILINTIILTGLTALLLVKEVKLK